MDDRQLRQLTLAEARHDLYLFCQLLDPEFYQPHRWHLKILANTLQAFFEDRISRVNGKWTIHSTPVSDACQDMILTMPPRHGKSRTAELAEAWYLGNDPRHRRIITGSYNDFVASEFSRFVRDIIGQERQTPDEVIFNDVFPKAKIKKDDGSVFKWSLEGTFFSYLGTGVGGSVTSKGCSLLVVDDPIKGAEEAYSTVYQDRVWLWITSTLMSRREAGSKYLHIQTRWPGGDPVSRMADRAPEIYENAYVLNLPAMHKGQMLAPDIFSEQAYRRMEGLMDRGVFFANYQGVIMDIEGSLYAGMGTYTEYPTGPNGESLVQYAVSYTDTADTGADSLAHICADVIGDDLYVKDVVFTPEPMEITENLVADSIYNSNVLFGWIESNNGGRGFARNVDKILSTRGWKGSLDWFHQSENKVARILSNASSIVKHVKMPHDWMERWPEFAAELLRTTQKSLASSKSGKAKHDDAPDALTGLWEKAGSPEVAVFI